MRRKHNISKKTAQTERSGTVRCEERNLSMQFTQRAPATELSDQDSLFRTVRRACSASVQQP
jgi:hypothetical protein